MQAAKHAGASQAQREDTMAYIEGGPGNDDLPGTDGDDEIHGLEGNDTIDGLLGDDDMFGGPGHDNYYVTAGDVVFENADEGYDSIHAVVTFALPDHVEALFLMSEAGAADGIGNASHNYIIGNGFDNTLHGFAGNDLLAGGGGADVLIGGTGDDEYYVDHVDDDAVELGNEGEDLVYASVGYSLWFRPFVEHITLLESGGAIWAEGNNFANILTGNASDNTLLGEGGDDVLDGGGGDDIMTGGAGDDTFYVRDAGDEVFEDAAGGTDTVHTAVSFTLPDHVEHLIMDLNEDPIDATGNDLDNGILGNDAANDIIGFDGNDGLFGYGGDDFLGGGDDNDHLNGGTGADLMFGGNGDDVIFVDDSGDSVFGGSGIDVVFADVNYELGGDVENLQLMALTAFTGIGNALANEIEGNDNDNLLKGAGGDDVLLGGNGDDTLDGGTDDDTLDGGTGHDTLIYTDGFDTMDGAGGTDTADFSPFGAAVWVNLAAAGTEAWTRDGADLASGAWRTIAELANVENLVGTDYDDYLRGNAGNNTFFYTGGLDTVDGDAGVDTADFSQFGAAVWVNLAAAGTEAWTRDDVDLDSGAWREIANLANVENLIGTVYDDFLQGNAGNNAFYYTGGLDTVNGGAGTDTVDFSRFGSAVWVDLAYTGTPNEAWTQDDVDLVGGTWREIANLTGIENVLGTAGDDFLAGNAANNRIDGGLGDDVIRYRGGFDFLSGGIGTDTADFSDFGAAVWVDLGYAGTEAWTQDDVDLVGGAWREIANLGGIENLVGTDYDDLLRGDAGENVLFYAGGRDTLDGAGGRDAADFSGFGAAVWVDLAYAGLEAWTQDDVDLVGGTWREIADLVSVEDIVGSDFADDLRGDDGDNRLTGGEGNDILTGRGGLDRFAFAPGFGSDTIADFEAGPGLGDWLELSLGADFDTFGEVMAVAAQVGADTVFDFGGLGQLTLSGVQAVSLVADDFLFV
jgi:Ca2+-binding RTX toxin-like protein